MAQLIKAVGALRPRIQLGKRADYHEVVELVARASSLNEGEVSHVLDELREVISYICSTGRAVNLEGLCSYTPSIKLDGKITVAHRLDRRLRHLLNTPGKFKGTILNRENIGKTPDEIVTIWNEEHPEDPVTP